MNKEADTYSDRLCLQWQTALTDLTTQVRHQYVTEHQEASSQEQLVMYEHIAGTSPTDELAAPSELSPLTAKTPQACLLLALARLRACKRSLQKSNGTTSAGGTASNQAGTSTAAQSAGPAKSQRLGSSPEPVSYTVLLQSTVLLLKLTHLAGSVTADSANTEAVVATFWNTLRRMCHSIAYYDHDTANKRVPSDSTFTDPETEPCHLSIMIVAMVMSLLEDMVKSKTAVADVCLQLLLALMPKGNKAAYKATAAELIKSGAFYVANEHAKDTVCRVHFV